MEQKYPMVKYCISLACCFATIAFATAQQHQQSMLYKFIKERRQHEKPSGTARLFSINTLRPPALPMLSQSLVLGIDKNMAKKIFSQKPGALSLAIPDGKGGTHLLELAQEDISTGGLEYGTLTGKGSPKKAGTHKAVHYRGYVAGHPASIASFSLFANGEAMALFSHEEGNFNVGKIKGSNFYVLYNSNSMKAKLGFECGAAALPVANNISMPAPTPTGGLALLCKKVRMYWEADYKLFNNNFGGNLTNTANYIAGVFNQMATMYQNEGILVELTQTYIWATQDPYNTNTAANALATLKSRWNGLGNNFNADLCMLIDGSPTNNGGLAYILVNDYCNRAFAYGYANVYANYSTVPVYSWDVEVLTHESGHLLGSQHTQWCGWNTGAGGTCGAIDNCFPVETTAACATCNAVTNTNPSPPAGFMGTVMSYCYLRNGIGVNLSYGFGPLPQAAIRASVSGAACPIKDSKWTGTVSTAWENAANWSCGIVPDASTDVSINSGVPNYPVVNSAATCRKITQRPSSTVRVNTGFSLRVAGTGN